MRPAVLLVGLLLAACGGWPAERDDAYNYRIGTYEDRLPLRFVRDAADPAPVDLDALARLRPALGPRARLRLEARDGPLGAARATRVGEVLRHRVVLEASRAPGRDEAVLVVDTPGIVAEACMQEPQRVGRTLWTFGDYSRQSLLPPGCANASMLLRQAAAAQDVLRGRALAPGAAGPMARAADRYLRRNDGREPPERAGEGRGGGGTTEEAQPASVPAQAAAPPGAQAPAPAR